MHELIVGFGEIGKAVKEAICPDAETYDASDEPFDHLKFSDVDVLHICFPYDNGFKRQLADYITAIKPKHIIVYSTVPIGTCGSIDERIVHSPVEGKHPDLGLSIRTMDRWFGYNTLDEKNFFEGYFNSINMRFKAIASTNHTEALKLLSTSEYGINIAFADYKQRVAENINMPYELTKEWNVEYNRLYRELGMGKRAQKYVLDKPSGVCGGHCVVPNAKLLNEQFPSDLLQRIIDMEVK